MAAQCKAVTIGPQAKKEIAGSDIGLEPRTVIKDWNLEYGEGNARS